MRRDGHIIEEITGHSNMSDAFDKVLRGKRRKQSEQGQYLLAHREDVIDSLAAQITDGTFTLGRWHVKDVCENGKHRTIQVLPLRDRIAANAIMTIVDQHLRKHFIQTTAASIKGRGTHYLLRYIYNDLQTYPEETVYAYKFDITKFYENVNQETVIACVQRVFKDKMLITILERFVRMLPNGVSIGLRSSQGLCNLLLSVHLDHILKDKHGVRFFYRYCDDGVVLAPTKKELWRVRDIVHQCIGSIGLSVKDNERVFPVEEGIDFLGYVIYPDHIRLRKRIKERAAKRLARVQSKKRKRELVASLYGVAKHADCKHLFYILTGKDMKSFRDLGVAYQPDDGKKRFPGAVISIRDLVNLPIVVKDFETGIKTEQGEDRCIVAIELNGEPRKFFTNSQEMKNILAQIRDLPDGFPFETVIKTENFGKGKIKYIFT